MMYQKISGFADEIAEDIKTQFAVLNKLNIGYFEPRGVDGKNISELTDQEVAALKQQMDQAGIRVSSIGSPIGKVKVSDDLEAHFEQFKRVVAIAKKLDVKFIRVFSFFHDGGEWTKEERDIVLSNLKRMSAYAAENDVILLHENEKEIYGDNAARCLDLMENLYCDHFKAVFDFANFVQCKQDTKEAFEALKKYVAYIHIKDAKFEDGSVVPAGLGDGNVEEILKELFRDGYDGFLSLEPHLGSFKGLENLEMGDLMSDLPEGGEGTFTLAYNALKNILDRIGE